MKNVKWTKEEIEALKVLYPKYLVDLISEEDLQKVFPHRTLTSIKGKASKLHFGKLATPKINKNYYNEILKRIKI